MKLALALLSLFYGHNLFATNDFKSSFLERIATIQGEYTVADGSSKSCSEGTLTFVKEDDKEAGFRIGQSIFIGPFRYEEAHEGSDSCLSSLDFSFTQSEVVQTTKIYRCPANAKKEESVSKSKLTLKNDVLIYESLGTKYKCIFKRVVL